MQTAPLHIAAFAALVALAACAPMPATDIDLSKGKYRSNKDITAARVSVRETSPDGKVTKDIQIDGLDSSGSQVLTAWAGAQRAVAESNAAAFQALGGMASTIARFAGVPAPAPQPAPTPAAVPVPFALPKGPQ